MASMTEVLLHEWSNLRSPQRGEAYAARYSRSTKALCVTSIATLCIASTGYLYARRLAIPSLSFSLSLIGIASMISVLVTGFFFTCFLGLRAAYQELIHQGQEIQKYARDHPDQEIKKQCTAFFQEHNLAISQDWSQDQIQALMTMFCAYQEIAINHFDRMMGAQRWSQSLLSQISLWSPCDINTQILLPFSKAAV